MLLIEHEARKPHGNFQKICDQLQILYPTKKLPRTINFLSRSCSYMKFQSSHYAEYNLIFSHFFSFWYFQFLIVLLIFKYMQNYIYNILQYKKSNSKMKIHVFPYPALEMEYGQYFETPICPSLILSPSLHAPPLLSNYKFDYLVLIISLSFFSLINILTCLINSDHFTCSLGDFYLWPNSIFLRFIHVDIYSCAIYI